MRVFVCDRDSHHGEVGTLTGEIASVPGTPTERQAIAMTPQDSPEARIARYDLVTNYRAGSSIEEMERNDDDGEWVRWEDVEGRLHEQAQEIERARTENNFQRDKLKEAQVRAEAAEARLRDLEGRTDDGPQPPQ